MTSQEIDIGIGVLMTIGVFALLGIVGMIVEPWIDRFQYWRLGRGARKWEREEAELRKTYGP